VTTVAFLGTSVTEGVAIGLPPYPTPFCNRLGWTGVNLGVGGSGFAKSPTFISRISTVVTANPDVVIIEGGANDVPDAGVSLAALTAALPVFFTALTAAVPTARIYVLSPWTPRSYTQSQYVATKAAILTAATPFGLPVIDWRAWITGTGFIGSPQGDGNSDIYWGSDNNHPSTAGNAYLGVRLAQTIQPPSTGIRF
jgi:lysophospholipase L1-like esterase